MLPSSLVAALSDYDLADWEPLDTGKVRAVLGPLRSVFEQVPDRRRREGRRHRLSALLLLGVLCELAGCRGERESYRWAKRLPVAVLVGLGFRRGLVPARSTWRDATKDVDADVVEALVSGHVQGIAAALRQELADAAWPGRLPLVHGAVDGKALRGARKKGSSQTLMLVAVLEVATGIVLAQSQVMPGKGKGGEIAAALVALDLVELVAGMVFTMDALHCQNSTAEYFLERGAHYVIALKGNRGKLFGQVKALPWDRVDAEVDTTEYSKGRTETRITKVLEAPTGLAFPGVARVVQVTRTRKKKGRPGLGKARVFYYLTSLSHTQASAALLHQVIRDHWAVEVHHYIRDVILGEDAHKNRTGVLPRLWAIFRNLALTLLRIAGHHRYKEVLEANRHDPWLALSLVT